MNDENPIRLRQRLVVFLDGTWNNKDDCTNVLNIYNLVKEGPVDDGWHQRKYYDEGVGTGVLDSISGGAFGDGLEDNVREAYDWLVEYFDDEGSGPSYRADEIYIFGFSRGSYTARSLAGFIARCGLLRRGAPLTVGQLWEGYGKLEREIQQEKEGLWDYLTEGQFRQLEKLVRDPWNTRGPIQKPVTDTERQLVHWSRRVRVTFLGVFDTVGAMGLDALAIPGLRSKAGRIHNMRISTIVQRFCHALAIDENRGGFQHTPLVEFVPNSTNKSRGGLKQRWFVGAHSNVGGGYETNPLAQIPLRWMLEEANQALVVHPLPHLPVEELPCAPRDSFSEFVGLIGPGLLRQKRNYRTLCPPAEVRAQRDSHKLGIPLRDEEKLVPGFSLQSHEEIDDSVWSYAAKNESYAPPQLVRYAAQQGGQADPKIVAVGKRAVTHDWPAKEAGGYWMLYLWSFLAGLGLLGVNQFFQLVPTLSGNGRGMSLIAAVVAAILVIAVDCGESRLNVRLALDPRSAVKRAYFAAIFWSRSIAVLLFVAGAIGATVFYLRKGWESDQSFVGASWQAGKDWWQTQWVYVALVALVVILAPAAEYGINLVQQWRGRTPLWRRDKRLFAECGRAALGAVAAVAILILTFSILALLGSALWHVAGHSGWVDAGFRTIPIAPPVAKAAKSVFAPDPAEGIFAGRFLFLLLAFAYAAMGLQWVGKPLARTNLGASTRLMFKSAESLQAIFERWLRLVERTSEKDEKKRLREARQVICDAVRESLWRDNLGFIPVYSLAWAYGMWFFVQEISPSAHWLGFEVADWPFPIPVWLAIVVVTAVADWVESYFHASYLDSDWTRPASSAKVAFANLATAIKFTGFAVGGLFTMAGIAWGSYRILIESHAGGWRGAVAATILLTAVALVAWVIFSSRWKLIAWLKGLRSGGSPAEV